MASPGATAPVELKPLTWRCTSSAVRGPLLRAARGGGMGRPPSPAASAPVPAAAAGSTYQGTTWPVSSK